MNQVEVALARVATVDLSRLRFGLMQKFGWSDGLCDSVEDRYRKFLVLMLLYPKHPLAPTRFIDEFWHAHILDTRAYHEDCNRLFGHYVHHRPHFLDSQESSKRLRTGFDITVKLYRMHFQIAPWTDEERPQYDPPLCIVESAHAPSNKQEVE